jgi:hypothetical protein
VAEGDQSILIWITQGLEVLCIYLRVSVELTEVGVNECGVQEGHKALGKKPLKGLSITMEIIEVVFKSDNGE